MSCTGFNILGTSITQAGVMRCCLSSVAEEYLPKPGEPDRNVELGAKSACVHCKQTFTLIEKAGRPVWVPDWQIRDPLKPSTP